jgi:hypothetical protein
MRSFLIENYNPEILGNIVLNAAWILFGILIFYLTDSYVRKRDILGKY